MLQNIFNHKILNSDEPVNVVGLNKPVQASYVWNLFRETKKNVLVVTNTLYDANNLYKSLSVLIPNNVLLFPMDDFLVSEAVAVSPELMSKRTETLNELSSSAEKHVVITNLMGYLRFLPSISLWRSLTISISKNEEVLRDKLISNLNMLGYKKESIVTKTGEYANRGYILDIFPYGYDEPVRILFFDNEVEEIRSFDASTQLSSKHLKELVILPFTEFINEKQVEGVPERQSLLPRVVKKVASISDYVDDFLMVTIDYNELKLAYQRILEEVTEFKETDQFNIDCYMHDLNQLVPNKYVNILSVDNYLKGNNEVYKTALTIQFNGNFEKLKAYVKSLISENKRVIVCLDNDSMIADFTNRLKLRTVITSPDKIFDEVVNVVKVKMPNGFIINDYVYLTANEVYRKNQVINYKSKFRYGSKIKDINKLKVGDYVVHASHGIGRYLGIVTLTSKGLKKDYVHLCYKDGDKLYIPVEKIELISKYSSNEGAIPRLNKLGGTDWAKQKARVKGKIKDIARELLETSAKRKLVPGFAFLSDDEEQVTFESNFAYQETADQLRAIKEIKEDMEKPYPMDRLLCGDVGYGKTEVAFRAIFKAVKSGKQVAFLCPTTILSKQHYENALERFAGFGINIAVLNRFVSSAQKNIILKDLCSGKIDLIIGTHRLLSKDVKYKDLGLLVIDEEQRFGVTHKEKIKEYKNTVDVLTLSATPIPRTLQMSLTGVRGLSLIETPPVDRYPIQTYVLRENEQVIKDAIYKELSRDGQVFILYNNVAKIESQVVRIKKLVPEAMVTYIHGQMNKAQIEQTMEQFVLGEYNVMVCTTIIETGIDIQNANTLIVLNADYFGLSQLYQIRGRIGRGTTIGYAYLMYAKNKELNDIAVKRLEAIKEFTELGSGYALAVRDLAIRGAGDILGSQQSGFIDTIGYEMYLRILNEEVERLKGKLEENTLDDETSAEEKPFIQVSTHISDKYADSEDLKIEIHKKINTIDSYEKLSAVKKELEDRFGILDEDVIGYMLEELFQVLAKRKEVMKVEQLDNKVVVYFSVQKSNTINGSELLSNLFKISSNFDVSYVNKILKITLNTKGLEKHFLYYLVKMISVIE